MAQFFRPSANYLARASLAALPILPAGVLLLLYAFNDSDYMTGKEVVRDQPVPFSHKHHVSGLGLDCRYCHTAVEESAHAGLPPTETCMTCHSQIWTNAEILEPVRESYRTNTPLQWTRVHDMPDFVFFNHSIHIAKGVGCESCHGRVDEMPLVWQANAFHMGFCLNCHRNPEKYVRPTEEVFTMGYKAENQQEMGERLVQERNIQKLEHCYACHR